VIAKPTDCSEEMTIFTMTREGAPFQPVYIILQLDLDLKFTVAWRCPRAQCVSWKLLQQNNAVSEKIF